MKPLLAIATTLLAAAGLGLSGYLLYASLQSGGVAGCTWSAFDCDAALASRWGKWFGVPVAAGGVGCYGIALIGAALAALGGRVAAFGWRMLELACPLAVGAGVWFVAVQATALDSFCLYCVLTHSCGLLMTVAAVTWRWIAGSSEDADAGPVGLAATLSGEINPAAASIVTGPPSLGLPTLGGVLGVVALAAGQLAAPEQRAIVQKAELAEDFRLDPVEADGAAPVLGESQTDRLITGLETLDGAAPTGNQLQPEPTRRRPQRREGTRVVKLLRERLAFDANKQALLGPPDATHVIVEMMDYACPHCREFHETLTGAVERFEGELAVAIMPVPGEILCNKYIRKARPKSAGACFAAKLSLALAEVSPDRFEPFHHWMLKAETIPTRTASLIEAQNYAPRQELSDTLRDAEGQIAQRIERHIELAASIKRRGEFGLPALLVGDSVIVGPPEDVDEFCEVLNDQLGVESVGVTGL